MEVFSYTIGGGLIPDFEWLYEVILWVVWYTHFGFGGLKLLKMVLVVTPLVLLYRTCAREGVPWPG